jgi:hypothetical protein
MCLRVQVVLEANQNVPVVTGTWILACQKRGKRLPYSGYMLKPLAQCLISFTNLSKRKRTQLQKHVEDLDGRVAGDMGKYCSHLVVGDATVASQKLQCAPRPAKGSLVCSHCTDGSHWLHHLIIASVDAVWPFVKALAPGSESTS